MRWPRGRSGRTLEALVVQQAQIYDAVVLLLRQHAYRPPAADPGPPHPLLLAALAAPSREGEDLLPLSVRDHEFLAVIGPGGGDAEAIWECAAGLALADGAPGVPCEGATTAFPVSRVFPPGLRAVAAPDADGHLQVWLTPSGEQRATLRRIRNAVRSERRTGHAAVVLGIVALAVGTFATVASMHGSTGHGAPSVNVDPKAPPVAVTAPDWRTASRRDHGAPSARHPLRGEGDSAGTGHLLHPGPAPTPSPSASITVLPGSPVPAVTITAGPRAPLLRLHLRHGCTFVLLVRICPPKRGLAGRGLP